MAEQRILKEEAEFKLLISFIPGLRGSAGTELKFRTPNSIGKALNIGTIIYNTEKLEKNRQRQRYILDLGRTEAMFQMPTPVHQIRQCTARLPTRLTEVTHGRHVRFADR